MFTDCANIHPLTVVLAGRKLTPEKLEQALAAAQALAPKLPTCMNPGAMNPVRYHSLQEKKKLLWSKKKVGDTQPAGRVMAVSVNPNGPFFSGGQK